MGLIDVDEKGSQSELGRKDDILARFSHRLCIANLLYNKLANVVLFATQSLNQIVKARKTRERLC